MSISQLRPTERQGEKESKLLQAKRENGIYVGQIAFGEAYVWIYNNFPFISSERDRVTLAFALALNSLNEAMRYVTTGIETVEITNDAASATG